MYLGVLTVMGYELTRDVLRASELVQQLQQSEAGLRESEARMSLAVDAGDFGIWIRDLTRNEIWASDKWRELYGFTPTEPVEFDAIVKRLHPDDRESFFKLTGRQWQGRVRADFRRNTEWCCRTARPGGCRPAVASNVTVPTSRS